MPAASKERWVGLLVQIVWWLWRDDDFGDVENDADDGDYGHVDERHGVRKIF